jgi:nicotinamidase-related amidase
VEHPDAAPRAPAPAPAATATVDPGQAVLLLIDVQPLFWDGMAGNSEPVLTRIEHLLKLAATHAIPVLATFEHPTERKGWLPERLEHVLPPAARRFVKRTFDLTAEPAIRAALAEQPRRQAVVAGAETDVCVLQSALGLLRLGFQVFLLEDCLFSSEPHPAPALRRMLAAGAIPLTYKTLAYELKRTVEAEPPERAWNEAEAGAGRSADRFVAPERLPPWEPAW